MRLKQVLSIFIYATQINLRRLAAASSPSRAAIRTGLPALHRHRHRYSIRKEIKKSIIFEEFRQGRWIAYPRSMRSGAGAFYQQASHRAARWANLGRKRLWRRIKFFVSHSSAPPAKILQFLETRFPGSLGTVVFAGRRSAPLQTHQKNLEDTPSFCLNEMISHVIIIINLVKYLAEALHMEITTTSIQALRSGESKRACRQLYCPQLADAFNKITDEGRFRLAFDMSELDFLSKRWAGVC